VKKTYDRAQLHRALDAVMDADELKSGDAVIIEAGWGGKGGKFPEDFRRFDKDTPGILAAIRGGDVWVKVAGHPYAFKTRRQALRKIANTAYAKDAGRAPAKYMHEAVNLYHLARTALSGKDDGRWARLNWAASAMHKKYPEVSATAFYMSLSDDWLR